MVCLLKRIDKACLSIGQYVGTPLRKRRTSPDQIYFLKMDIDKKVQNNGKIVLLNYCEKMQLC